MKSFLKVIVVFLLSFAIATTGAFANNQLEQGSTEATMVASQPEASAIEHSANEEDTPKSVSNRKSSLFRVLAGVVGFGAIIASAVTNSPVDSVKYIALSIGADQITRKEDDASQTAVRR